MRSKIKTNHNQFYTRDLSRALSKLQVIAKNSDSFIALFSPVLFGGVVTLVFVFQWSFEKCSKTQCQLKIVLLVITVINSVVGISIGKNS